MQFVTNILTINNHDLRRFVPQSALELLILCQLYDHKADPLWILFFMPTEQIKY